MVRAIILFCSVLLLFGGPVGAGEGERDLDMRMAEIRAGSVALYETETGERVTMVFRGPVEGGFLIEVRAGEGAGAPLQAQIFTDERGQRIARRSGAGESRFYPHDCQRSVGVCQFRTQGDEAGRKERRVSRLGDGLYAYELRPLLRRGAGPVEETGSFRLGPFGVARRLEWSRADRAVSLELIAFLPPG